MLFCWMIFILFLYFFDTTVWTLKIFLFVHLSLPWNIYISAGTVMKVIFFLLTLHLVLLFTYVCYIGLTVVPFILQKINFWPDFNWGYVRLTTGHFIWKSLNFDIFDDWFLWTDIGFWIYMIMDFLSNFHVLCKRLNGRLFCERSGTVHTRVLHHIHYTNSSVHLLSCP